MALSGLSDEEILLKRRARQRLIGAVALVLGLIIFLPMLLEDKPKPVSNEMDISLPPKPNTDFPVATKPSNPPTPPPVPTTKPSTPPIPDALPGRDAPKPASADAHYVVQLGVFANPNNAEKLLAAVALQGMAAQREIVKSAQGDKTRVRVGPYTSREEANATREKLKNAGINGVVVTEKYD